MVFGNHVIYEIMWKNIVQPDRTHTSKWRMSNGCTKAPQCYSICTLSLLYLVVLIDLIRLLFLPFYFFMYQENSMLEMAQ